MSRIAGRPVLGAPEAPMGEMAVRIHAVEVTRLEYSFKTWVEPALFAVPPGGDAALWEAGFAAWLAGPPHFEPVLIHRDYHPGNLTWHRGAISGVVDWAHGCAGPAGLDLSTCWWNLINQVGLQRADAYVQRYEAMTGSTSQWFWMLDGLLSPDRTDWGRPEMVAKESLLRLVVNRLA
jgi:Ser/Thr protein kinase RdoA (MazF antagonist)